MEDLPHDKRQLRRMLLAQRRGLTDRQRRQAALNRALLASPVAKRAADLRIVAVFSALPDEASPASLAAHLRSLGVPTVYPRVEGPNLRFCEATPEVMVRSERGIYEPPVGAPETPVEQIDLFVVPGLAFTLGGERLGYGGGFYDKVLSRSRSLRSTPSLTVGLGFAMQVVEVLPVEPHDQRLDFIITEDGCFATRAPPG